jgi:hypothetical protein
LRIPAAHQRLLILPSRHRFTFLVVSRAIESTLDAVGAREARGEPAADTEPPDGEHVLEAFAQARRRIGPTRLELRGEVPTGTFTLGGIVVVERGGELAIDPRLLVLREVVADVAALVQRAPRASTPPGRARRGRGSSTRPVARRWRP